MTTYTSTLERDGDDLILPIPPEILAELKLKPGDEVDVQWVLKEGIITLRAKH